HRTYLRGTGHRPRWEGRTEQVAVPDALVETTDDVGDQMPHAGVAFRARLIGHPDGSGQAHATDVVAHQVDDHDVLGAVLPRRREVARIAVQGRGPLDRRGADLASGAAQEQL